MLGCSDRVVLSQISLEPSEAPSIGVITNLADVKLDLVAGQEGSKDLDSRRTWKKKGEKEVPKGPRTHRYNSGAPYQIRADTSPCLVRLLQMT